MKVADDKRPIEKNDEIVINIMKACDRHYENISKLIEK